MAAEQRRGVWWWITAILAPIGILGGPIAIAEMLAGWIDWGGPFEYMVAWWDEKVAVYFEAVFKWIARSLELPTPPEWLTNYLTLGIIFSFSFNRAFLLTPNIPDRRQGWFETTGAFYFTPFVVPFVWPLFLVIPILSMFSPTAKWPRIILILLPFFIFIVMFVLNQIYYVG